MDKKFEENDVYEPLINQEDKKIYSIDEADEDEDDKIQTKCFAFKTEIKITFKYILKECPKLF